MENEINDYGSYIRIGDKNKLNSDEAGVSGFKTAASLNQLPRIPSAEFSQNNSLHSFTITPAVQ